MMKKLLYVFIISSFTHCSFAQEKQSEGVFSFGTFGESQDIIAASDGTMSLLGINHESIHMVVALPGQIQKYNGFKNQYIFRSSEKGFQFIFTGKSDFLLPKYWKSKDRIILGTYYAWEKEFQGKSGEIHFTGKPEFEILPQLGKEVLIYSFELSEKLQTQGEYSVVKSTAGSLLKDDTVVTVLIPVMKRENPEDRLNEFHNALESIQFFDERVDFETLKKLIQSQ